MSSTSTKKSFFSKKIIMGTTIGAATVFFFAGIIFWGGFHTAMEATNTLKFCISCHEMEEGVYKEYKPTIHYSNRSGVRTSCSDCHVPKPWAHKVVRKIKATNEIWHKLLGSIDTPEKFDAKRLELAKKVWISMKETDSRECRNCHHLDSMNPALQKPRARKQHLNAFTTGQTCIDCHKGIAHKNARDLLSDEELEQLEKPNPAFIKEIPQMFLDSLEQVELAEENAEIEAKEAAIKAKEKIQKQIDAAVARALGNSGVTNSNINGSSVSTSADKDFGIDWQAVPKYNITIFYPGQASMEWMLTGKDHGGARAFVKLGDRCTTCHAKETNKMGDLIVSGEKLETQETLIPGKRGHIPVSVQARYDDENLYMRFEWENSEHTPAPFIEGGKMDAKNQMKLAVLFATDEVEYAQQAGCWGACHHDLNTMPHHPAGEDVSKYIDESRTAIEVKGRRGKKRGGWNNLKDDEALKAEFNSNHFLDIIRYKAGEGKSEDGHILADRNMTSDGKTQFSAVLNSNNTWVVQMKRKLNSGNPADINMTTDKMYNFSFAIHDDYTTARYHHVSLGYFLGFDNDKAEVNAVKIN
ncbi:Cytochrome c-type protein NapC [hydrothermal vent metagenome]|uniref:Cytochrome c-type protein NapC n=1 Tax=hydrothermal vent metagenome TaxID=652676 RepID=A0A3B0W6H2_9ZZZZ